MIWLSATLSKEGDPILNKVCRPVTNFDDRLATLLDDMRETMIQADGVGLAGPQVGMLRRLFVVWDTTDAPEEIPEGYEYKFIDFVNPEILEVSEEKETHYEGCLSFPGHNGAVTRPAAVKVRAQDRHGNWFELEADGLLGRWHPARERPSGRHHHHAVQRLFLRGHRGGPGRGPQSKGAVNADRIHGDARHRGGLPGSAVRRRTRHLRRPTPGGISRWGRKQVLTPPPVKQVAQAHGTPVFQPRTLRDGGEDAISAPWPPS